MVESKSSDAGWSSLAARRAHNPKVVGSNPAPATKYNWSIATSARPVLFCTALSIKFMSFLYDHD